MVSVEDPLVGEHTFPQCRKKNCFPKRKTPTFQRVQCKQQSHAKPLQFSSHDDFKVYDYKNNYTYINNPAFFETLACHAFISAYFFWMSLSVELRFLEPEHQSLQEFLMFLFNGPEWMSNSKKHPFGTKSLPLKKKGWLWNYLPFKPLGR